VSTPRPTAPSERNLALDVLHGVALLGVVMVDVPMFFRPVWREFDPAWAAAESGAAAWVRAATVFFFQTKALSVFAVLFGSSFAILRRNFAARDGGDFRLHFARRMTALWVLGALQGVLLWYNSVLVALAAAGAACLALEPLSSRARRTAAAALFVLGFLGAAAAILANRGAAQGAHGYFYHLGYLAGLEDGTYSAGSWARITALRAATFVWLMPPALLLFGARLLSMTLAGVELFESGRFEDSEESRRFWSACARVGLAVGLPLQAVTVWTETLAAPSTAVLLLRWTSLYLGGAVLAAAYTGLVCLWVWGAPPSSRAALALGRAGRMSLTNFIAFIACGSWLAYPYGLGLYGRLSAPAAAALGVLLYGALLALSAAWLARFRFGPFEWLLRAAAYCNAPAMSR
jgi:uncharacterized protein